jgi:hypothetical protein
MALFRTVWCQSCRKVVLFWASSKSGIFARKRENGTRSARPFGVNLVEQHRAGGAPTRRSDLRDQCGTCWAAPRVCRRGAGCATSVHHRQTNAALRYHHRPAQKHIGSISTTAKLPHPNAPTQVPLALPAAPPPTPVQENAQNQNHEKITPEGSSAHFQNLLFNAYSQIYNRLKIIIWNIFLIICLRTEFQPVKY